MTQLPHAELISTASMNAYHWQHKLDRPQSHRCSEKPSRNRGVFLSQRGWQKLVQAGVLHTEYGERHTYEELSARSLLDKRTVSRLLSCEVKVDKGTLKIFFRAFNLSLETGDYASSRGNEVNDVKLDASAHATLMLQKIEFEQIVEDLLQLKQQLREYDRLFQRLGLNESHISQQLRA
ncbi:MULTISPECIES: hypothetical protein [Trichocoleus]|uniref:Uncharacterized protein n=1 Tax=Trichocoleus desertorum GB2-A4 TaxID=2933944 RepID=A0ABV0JFV0_9CYAN|nr:hypothetical protein [Trichocoleus sp. FACHB-46]MBD1865610.1 hypothetical protein [Trichocoleus sp. FACHB-46]